MNDITAIFSDLGNVVVRFDDGRTVGRLDRMVERYGPSSPDTDVRDVLFHERAGLKHLLERGIVPGTVFLEMVKTALRLDPRLPADMLADAWSDVFTVNDDVFGLLCRAKASGTPVIAVSDADPLRIERLQCMGIMRVFAREVVSFREKRVKTDGPEFFVRALDRIGRKAEQILYVDDRRDCLDVAARLGITTFHYMQDRPGEAGRLERELLRHGLITVP